MDNITHTLTGWMMARAGLGRSAGRGSALMMAAERRKKPKILIRRDRYSPPARPGVLKDVPFGGPPRGLGSGADPRSAAMLI